jgi:magnesium transporter
VRQLTEYEHGEVARLRAGDEFFWLDLEAPSPELVGELGRQLEWHPVAIEDSSEFRQRPKLDDYGDHLFIVFYGIEPRPLPDSDPAPIEVHIYISGGYVVTLHREPCAELGALRERFARRPAGSEQFVIYSVLDSLTDTFFPVLESFDDEIDKLESAITTKPDDEQLQRLFRLKRQLVAIRRLVAPMRDLMASNWDQISDLPGLESGQRDYFRDVYDHLLRITEMIDSYRDVLTSAMDVYLSTVSNRLNDVMKQLTVIATIFMPLTFLTGFFGQNFGWLVERIDTFPAFLGWGVGGLLVPLVLLGLLFRKRGWI